MRRAALMILILAAACTEEETQNDAGIVQTLDAAAPDATTFPDAEPLPAFSFESTDPPAGPALVFAAETATLDATTLSVEIAGRELTNVHGVAFRVSHDPAVLTFVSLEGRGAFPANGLEESKEARPGLMVAAFGQIGAATGVALDGVSVARLTFQRLAETPATVRLERGFALDANGFEIKIGVSIGNIVQR